MVEGGLLGVLVGTKVAKVMVALAAQLPCPSGSCASWWGIRGALGVVDESEVEAEVAEIMVAVEGEKRQGGGGELVGGELCAVVVVFEGRCWQFGQGGGSLVIKQLRGLGGRRRRVATVDAAGLLHNMPFIAQHGRLQPACNFNI